MPAVILICVIGISSATDCVIAGSMDMFKNKNIRINKPKTSLPTFHHRQIMANIFYIDSVTLLLIITIFFTLTFFKI